MVKIAHVVANFTAFYVDSLEEYFPVPLQSNAIFYIAERWDSAASGIYSFFSGKNLDAVVIL